LGLAKRGANLVQWGTENQGAWGRNCLPRLKSLIVEKSQRAWNRVICFIHSTVFSGKDDPEKI
jgi:hypothetical protein